MPNKTIYVKDELLWEQAKKFAGETGLSGLLAEALKEYVERKEREAALRAGEMTKVELPVGGSLHDDEPRHRIGFIGRLLYDTDVEADPRCMVFETQRKRLLLYKTNAHPSRDDGATYEVFSSYEELARSTDARNNFWLIQEQGRPEHEGVREIAAQLGKEPLVWIA
jgi:hypothetical protein